MKIGIEFEMTLYDRTPDKSYINQFIYKCEELDWVVGTDRTITVDERIARFYRSWRTAEVRTKPYDNIDELMQDIHTLFDEDWIGINHKRNGKMRLRIDFNESTGTHIHFSNKTKEEYKRKEYGIDNYNLTKINGTPECKYFHNKYTIETMITHIQNNCKYNSIKKDFYRPCVEPWQNHLRYSIINTTDRKRYGTIEFRMFNLHGIKTVDFYSTIEHLLVLTVEAILIGYKYMYMTVFHRYEKVKGENLFKAGSRLAYLYEDLVKQLNKFKVFSEVNKKLLTPAILNKFKVKEREG